MNKKIEISLWVLLLAGGGAALHVRKMVKTGVPLL